MLYLKSIIHNSLTVSQQVAVIIRDRTFLEKKNKKKKQVANFWLLIITMIMIQQISLKNVLPNVSSAICMHFCAAKVLVFSFICSEGKIQQYFNITCQ